MIPLSRTPLSSIAQPEAMHQWLLCIPSPSEVKAVVEAFYHENGFPFFPLIPFTQLGDFDKSSEALIYNIGSTYGMDARSSSTYSDGQALPLGVTVSILNSFFGLLGLDRNRVRSMHLCSISIGTNRGIARLDHFKISKGSLRALHTLR